MASSLTSFSCLVYFVLLFPTLSTSQNAFVCSRAAFYGNPYSLGTASGTCGFGEFGSTLNGGNVAAVSDLFRHGAGCGACYQGFLSVSRTKSDVKVTEHSNYPHYIALIPIYQGGMKDIVAVQIWQEDCHEWKEMRRAYSGVRDMANPPRGPLNLRLQVSGEDGQKPIIPLGQVIPGDWKCGAVYDSNLQLH